MLDANRLPRDPRVARLGAGAEHGDDLPDALSVDHVLDAVVANHQRIARVVVVVVVPVPPHGGASAVCSFPSHVPRLSSMGLVVNPAGETVFSGLFSVNFL